MSLLDTLELDIRQAAHDLYDLAVQAGVKPRVTSARRSYAKQQALYTAYVEGRSRYPAAPPGTSAHEYGEAFDMVVDNATDQTDLGSVWVSWGGVYGGEEDPVHFASPNFVPPRQTTATDTGPPRLAHTPGISQSARKMAETLADLFVGFVPGLGSIVGTAAIANAILQITGTDQAGLDLLTWGLSHPFEFFGYIQDAFWAILRSYF